MNRLTGTITSIVQNGDLHFVQMKRGEFRLSALTLELPSDFREGTEVFVLFKETEVILAREPLGDLSLQNRLGGEILSIEIGKILAKAVLAVAGGTVTAIITADSAKRMDLRPGDRVIGLIKATEVSFERIGDG